MLITTIPSIPNAKVKRTFAAIFIEEAAQGTLRVKGFADLRRLFSPPSDTTGMQLSEMRTQALKTLTVMAGKLEANAIVGLQITFVTTETGLFLVASGTPQEVEFDKAA